MDVDATSLGNQTAHIDRIASRGSYTDDKVGHAGIDQFNALAGGHLPIYLRPIDRYPGDELKAWFAADFDTQPGYERLRADSLTGFLERVTRLLGAGRVVVILLDQFEEFFYYQPEGERKRFAAELADCVERLRDSVRWVA